MKRTINIMLLGFIVFSFGFGVNASSYSVKELIPVDQLATVKTDLFTYQDFMYQSTNDSNSNTIVTFNKITNLSDDSVPVSINLLLFNKDKKNIGYLSYCTDQDFDSDYNRFHLKANESTSFSITVSSRYFTTREYEEDNIPKKEQYKPSDVSYIAVMDENQFCRIGGYSNYKDLTIEEITIGKTANDRILLRDIPKMFTGVVIPVMVIIVGIIIVIYFAYGAFLNSLHKKMYQNGTILAYLPIANYFILMKVVYGPQLGLILFIASLVPVMFIRSIGYAIYSGISFFSFIFAVIKFITRKYELFYYVPSSKKINTSQYEMNVSNTKQATQKNEPENNSNRFVDLSYQDKMNTSDFNDSTTNTISQGGSGSTNNNSNQNNNKNKSNGESDLSNMFK